MSARVRSYCVLPIAGADDLSLSLGSEEQWAKQSCRLLTQAEKGGVPGSVLAAARPSWRDRIRARSPLGFPGGSVMEKETERRSFDPRVRKIPWSGKWQPIPVFLLGTFHAQGSLGGYSPRVAGSDTTERAHTQAAPGRELCCFSAPRRAARPTACTGASRTLS